MARTVTEIHNAILTDISNNSYLSGLTSTSRYAKFRQFAYIIAVAINLLEQLFDLFKADVRSDLSLLKPHTLLWYRNKALLFQYGSSLPYGTDIYDNTGKTAEQIEDEQIVKYAAVIENPGQLLFKVAKLDDDDLAALLPAELSAFETYMEKVKDAGVKIDYVSDTPDYLKLQMTIYYDPLVLDSSGQRLDGTDNEPVQTAINNYLQNLPFNAEFSKTALMDALQAVEGVELVNIANCWTKYGALNYSLITERYTPQAGYLRIYDPVTELLITWTVH